MHRSNQLVFIVWLISYSHGSLLDFINITDVDEMDQLGEAFIGNIKDTLSNLNDLSKSNLLNGQVLRVVTVNVNKFNFHFRFRIISAKLIKIREKKI